MLTTFLYWGLTKTTSVSSKESLLFLGSIEDCGEDKECALARDGICLKHFDRSLKTLPKIEYEKTKLDHRI